MKAVSGKVTVSIEDAFHYFGLFMFIKGKERVHRPFLTLILLMSISPFVFLLVEGRNNEFQTETADVILLINKLEYAEKIDDNRSNLMPEDDYIIPGN